MRTKKRSRAAKDRERLKKQRIDPLNAASEGSQYNPSDRDSESTNQSNITKDPARNTLYNLWEAQSSDASESDGETMLGLDDSFDENDWDPEVVPDLYSIFTEPVTTFKFAEKALRAPVYTGESRTTKWRRQVADFKAEKPLLQLIVEEAGHLCVLLPKFHCELNPIEIYWGYAKQRFRGRCTGSFSLAKELVPDCLDACPIQTIRRFFQKTWRYMDAYRQGLTGMMAEHAVKTFTSHRKISKRVMMEVAMLIT